MASRLIAAHLDLNQNQLLNAVVQVLTADPGGSIGGQFWYRSDLSNGVGNGVMSYKDSSGNVMRVAVGGVALSNAYIAMTDGTTTTTTSGGETFQPVAAGTGLSVAVVNNNAGFGSRDTFTYTLNSGTSGANKVLLLDGSGGIAHGSYVVLGAGSLTAGKLGWNGTNVTIGDGTTNNQLVDTSTTQSIGGAKTFLTSPILTTLPAVAGAIGYNLGSLYYYNGAVIQIVGTNTTDTLSNKTLNAPTILDLSNMGHSHQNAAGGGTLLKAAMPSFDTYVQLNRLDQMAAPTSDVSWNTHKITNLLDPTNPQDAATKIYVDTAVAGIDWKGSVRVATTSALPTNTYNNGTNGVGATLTATANGALGAVDGVNLGAATSQTISAMTNATTTVTATVPSNTNLAVGQTVVISGAAGLTNVNGTWTIASLISTTQFTFVVTSTPTGTYTASTATATTAADRLLVKNEATAANDGIYAVTQVGTASLPYILTRATDSDAAADLTGGAATWVNEGTTNQDTGWVVTTNDPIVIGTTPLAFTQFSGLGQVTAGNGLTKTGNQIDVVTASSARIVVAADSIDLATVGTAGTYTQVTTDVYGRVTAGQDIVTANGYVARTAAGTFAARSITVASSARITVTNSNGVSGDTTLDLATVVTAGTGIITNYDVYGRVTSTSDLIGGAGIPARTAANTYAARTITGTAGNITVTNGDGLAGNPTINLPNVGTAGTYDTVTTDAQGRVTAGRTQSFAGNIGDGSSTTITVTHNLATQDVIVAVYSATTPWAEVYPEVRHSTTNTVQLLFNVAPTLNQYRVVVKSV